MLVRCVHPQCTDQVSRIRRSWTSWEIQTRLQFPNRGEGSLLRPTHLATENASYPLLPTWAGESAAPATPAQWWHTSFGAEAGGAAGRPGAGGWPGAGASPQLEEGGAPLLASLKDAPLLHTVSLALSHVGDVGAHALTQGGPRAG